MKYGEQDPESKNVEDRRDEPGGGVFRFPGRGGQGIPIPIQVGGRGGLSLGTIVIIIVVMLLFGINPLDILTGGGGGGGPGSIEVPLPHSGPGRPQADRRPEVEIPGLPGSRQATVPRSDDDMKRFVGQVLKDTEDVWNRQFASWGRQYEEPGLVLYRDMTRTGCGFGQAAMGPFYCPRDHKLYVDLAFYDQLQRRFHVQGDFAQAYVIAHEVGHHVQSLLGVMDKVEQYKQRARDESDVNAIQVKVELQADCLAGVWANLNQALKSRLDAGDIDEGLNAANAIGDDMLQKRAQGYVVPDSFTHGSSAQRVRWFKRGFEAGDVQSCDTFGAPSL